MTHSSKSSSSYSRFIPREEIEAVAAWRFANVDGTPHEDELKAQLPVGPSAEELAAQAEAQRQQELAEAYARGHADGCNETRSALEAPTRQHLQQVQQQLAAVMADAQQHTQRLQADMAQAVLQMACDLARQVIRRELSMDPLLIQPVVQEAVALLAADGVPVTVRLHPDDWAALTAAADASAPEPPVRWVADATLAPGGCVVEAATTRVDATLQARWRRAIANLGLNTEWAPETQAPHGHE